MIKRITLVWKKAGLSDVAFKAIWLGEHATLAKQLANIRAYVIDFIADAPAGAPSGIATLRFDSREDLDAAFADRQLSDRMLATRNDFADRVQIFFADENVLINGHTESRS